MASTRPPSAGIGQRLRRLRLAKKLGSRELARVAGLSEQHVSAIELRSNLRVWPDPIEKLAKVLGCEPQWLLFGTGTAPDVLGASKERKSTPPKKGAARAAR